MKVGAGLLGAGGLAALGIGFGSQSTLAADASLSASDVTLDTNAGQLQKLYVAPDVTYSWDGLEAEPDTVEFFVQARLPDKSSGSGGDFEKIGGEKDSVSSTALDGSDSYSFSNNKSILSHSNVSDSDFEPTGDGGSKDTKVEVKVRTVLTDANGNTYTDPDSATFTVTLNDQTGTVDADGQANTGGSGK